MKGFNRVAYAELNARQKENYNFHKASGILAEFGFTTLRLTDDWNGADFIALHVDGSSLKVQLKARLSFDQKYVGRDIWICFPAGDGRSVYLYPHDELLEKIKSLRTTLTRTKSWVEDGKYHFPRPAEPIRRALGPYKLTLQSAVPAQG
jgi:hypothetical protein